MMLRIVNLRSLFDLAVLFMSLFVKANNSNNVYSSTVLIAEFQLRCCLSLLNC